MKVYIPNISKQKVGGGWTFMRNLKKALKDRVLFVNTWQESDIVFIVGATITDPYEVIQAKKAGKGIIHRVDNIPKKSRNKRCTPHERMKQLSELSDVVLYQSEWAKEYCSPLCGDGAVIYNGVDTDIFYPAKEKDKDWERYLFAYHGKSELKAFWVAHYFFQRIFRENKNCDFWFINDFGRDLPELQEAKFDFWNGESYTHLDKCDTPEQMAEIMRGCTHLIFPSVADASPNTVLEARACGLEVIGSPSAIRLKDGRETAISGTRELLEPDLDISLERMGDEYFGVFSLLLQDKQQVL